MTVPNSDEVGTILCEADGLHLAGELVGGHLDAAPPVPHVDYHVVLRPHRHHILLRRGECLQEEERRDEVMGGLREQGVRRRREGLESGEEAALRNEEKGTEGREQGTYVKVGKVVEKVEGT